MNNTPCNGGAGILSVSFATNGAVALQCNTNCAPQTNCNNVCTDLETDPSNCGSCGNQCQVANGTAGCMASACTVAACSLGYADCDVDPKTGCEINLLTDVEHCGKCDVVCSAGPGATSSCESGSCASTCNPGRADCDGDAKTGCEIDVWFDPNNCGGCGTVCTSGDCQMGYCQP